MTRRTLIRCTLAAVALAGPAAAATPAELLAAWHTEAGAAADPARGQALFTGRHGSDWRCASCHGDTPTAPGRHAVTGKTLAPLAPAAAPERFTDRARAEKWFRRNCKDVLARECTPLEKADVLAWLITLQPSAAGATR